MNPLVYDTSTNNVCLESELFEKAQSAERATGRRPTTSDKNEISTSNVPQQKFDSQHHRPASFTVSPTRLPTSSAGPQVPRYGYHGWYSHYYNPMYQTYNNYYNYYPQMNYNMNSMQPSQVLPTVLRPLPTTMQQHNQYLRACASNYDKDNHSRQPEVIDVDADEKRSAAQPQLPPNKGDVAMSQPIYTSPTPLQQQSVCVAQLAGSPGQHRR